jgi:Mg2+-importing ATPase
MELKGVRGTLFCYNKNMNNIPLTDLMQGLTSEQVMRAPKNIPVHHVSNIELGLVTFKNQVMSFFFLLLIVSGILSLFLHQTLDASLFFIIAGINAIIGFFQEFRASKSALTLEKLVAHTVEVRRDGTLQTVSSNEVVLGDIINAEPGDVIVADMIMRGGTDVLLDESVLTGETMPRTVNAGETISSGVSIVQGSLVGQVVGVGKTSSLLLYADKISTTKKYNNFETFINTVSKYILIFTVVCLLLVLAMNVLVAHQLVFSEYILFAISILVGVVPESLPIVVTLILTREALKLSQQNVIVKKLSVLENLGSMEYLFTDKTGTITENKLKVQDTLDEGDLKNILTVISSGVYERTPMDSVFDQAITAYIGKINQDQELTFSPFEVARGYAMYTLPDGTEIARGQYKAILSLCGDNQEFANKCNDAEGQGLRIIALAVKQKDGAGYKLAGAVMFEDPLKQDAVDMYTKMQELGVTVKIITGDSVQVATYIAHILDPKLDVSSVYSMDMWQGSGKQALEGYSVYARCRPDQKAVLIDEHVDNGVVGFLGEGINDALALKRADIGFVVNNASDVARQSADVILLEKSLNPVVTAVTLSRRAFIHLRTYLLCTLTGDIGTLISLTAVAIFWQQIPMLPIQILLNNLLTDVPLMFIVLDNLSEDEIKKPIRIQPMRFFNIIFIFALLSSVFDFIFFFSFKHYDISIVRTGWFVFSVLAELTLVFSLRSELSFFKSPKMSRVLLGILGVCYVVAFILPYISIGSVFHLIPLSLVQMGIIVGITIVYFGLNELVKWLLFKPKRV